MKTKIFSLVLAICLVICVLPISASAEESKPIVVIAGSDFQAETREEGLGNVKAILSAVKADGYESAFGLLFCGDYNNEYDAKSEDIAALKDAVKAEFSDMQDENMIFVQGNHDPNTSKGLSKSGEHDNDNYGVFVINEDDYMWYNDNETRIKMTANKLDGYLKEKSESGYKKPIFIASHLALNYSKRTYNSGDGKYAKYLVDVLNTYGEKLNIIFLFGHNHNNHFDDYIGGSNVFLAKGDTMYVSKPGQNEEIPDAYTINFTYLNAGYLGTVYLLNGENTMTVFEIEGDIVSVKRYGINGMTALKTQGAWASNLNETAQSFGTTNDYLKLEYSSPEYIGMGKTDKNVTVLTSGIENLTVSEDISGLIEEFHNAYVKYTFDCVGYKEGEKATVKIVLPDSFNEKKPLFVRFEDGVVLATTAVNGKIAFNTQKLGSVELFQTQGATVGSEKKTIYMLTDQFSDGRTSLIVSQGRAGKAYALKCDKDGNISQSETEIKLGYGSVYIESAEEDEKWQFINDSDFGYASVIGDLKSLSCEKLLVAPEGSSFALTDNTETDYTAWRVSSGQNGIYTLKDNGNEERYYLKFDNGFYVSVEVDTSKRAYLYTEKSITVKTTAYAERNEATVDALAGGDTLLGSKLYLTAPDGREEYIDVTLSMLRDESKNPVSAEKAGVYGNLSIYYGEKEVLKGFTLTVAGEDEPNESDSGDMLWLYITVAAAVVAGIAICALLVVKKRKSK